MNFQNTITTFKLMKTYSHSVISAPLTDPIIIAVSRMVGDAQSEAREPSHSDIEFQIKRVGLEAGDPRMQGQVVGKAKRVRGVLSWALENNLEAGEIFVANLISLVKGCGGFRPTSSNYIGNEAIQDVTSTFKTEGFELTSDGELRRLVLDNLTGVELTGALEAYVRRAKRGVMDAALVTGTSKDLLEATAAHILQEIYGAYPTTANFPTLLGQAFTALGWVTPQEPLKPGEQAQKRLERAMYEMACAINTLRNKEGTGHGRPWLPTVTEDEAKSAIEFMGVLAERMLSELKRITKPKKGV